MHTYIYILHPICDWAYLTSLALFHVDRQSLMTGRHFNYSCNQDSCCGYCGLLKDCKVLLGEFLF